VHPATRWKIAGGIAVLPALIPAVLLWPALSGHFVPAFRDQSDFFFPSHLYTVARLVARQLPLWNSLAGNGETWIGNGQNEIFYPPAALFFVRNAALGAGLFLLFHFVIGYLLAFLFLRGRGTTRPATIVGSSLFGFSALAVSLSAYWNHFAGMVWMPGMAAAALRGLRTRKQRGAFAACLGLTLLAGSPESALFGIFAAALVFTIERPGDRERNVEDSRFPVRSWSAFAGSVCVGAMLGAIEIVPLIDTILRSDRRAARSGAIPVTQFLSFVRSPSLSRYGWLPPGASYLQSLYVSLPILVLVVVALAGMRAKSDRFAWLAVAAGATAFSFVNSVLPFRYPAKLMMLALLSLSVLASEGVDALRFGSRRRYGLAALVLLAAVVGTAAWAGPGRGERLTLVIGAALLSLSAVGNDDFRGVMASLGAAVLAVHFALSAGTLPRFVRLSTMLAPPLPAQGKVLTTPDGILSSWATSALPDENARVRRQIDSLEGYSNLPFGISKATTGSARPSRESSRFMNQLIARTDFVVPAMVSGSKEIRFPQGGRVAHVVLPRTLAGASFFSRAEVEPDFRVALHRATAAGFDPLRTLIVGEKVPDAPAARSPSGRSMAVGSRISETPERVEYTVDVSDGVWMYRAQSWDPWWIAFVDGKRTPIVRANGVFSAIVVPKGEHRVVWRYRPLPFYAGAAVSAAGLLLLLFFSFAGEPPLRTK
jgi:hypothetical protein